MIQWYWAIAPLVFIIIFVLIGRIALVPNLRSFVQSLNQIDALNSHQNKEPELIESGSAAIDLEFFPGKKFPPKDFPEDWGLTQESIDNGELTYDWRKDVEHQEISTDSGKFGSTGYSPGGVSYTGGEPIVPKHKAFQQLIKRKGRK